MKICAVICEFNPFHNGHKYLLQQAKKLSCCDATLCIMSGNFVQRAEYAIVNKSLRTEFALKNGADFVVELPAVFSASQGEVFAQGAVSIISQIPAVTHLAFGCECGNGKILESLAKIQFDEPERFKLELKKMLSSGMSFAQSYCQATKAVASMVGLDSNMTDIVLSKPNNLLAIEYLKQIYAHELTINPIAIKRTGSDYNDDIIHENYSSASALRKKLTENSFECLKNNIPDNCIEKLKQELALHSPNKKIFDSIIINALRCNNLSNLLGSGEGLEIKLSKNAMQLSDLEQIYIKTKTKRYTHSRIRRLGLQAVLQISKASPLLCLPSPIRLLGVKKSQIANIGLLAESLIIQNKDFNNLPDKYSEYKRIEKHAASLYGVVTSCKDSLFTQRLVIV